MDLQPNSRPASPSRRRLLGGAALGSGVLLAGGLDVTGYSSASASTAAPAGGVRLTPTARVVGTGMPMVGYNLAHFLPGSNTSAWLDYAMINTARFFCGPSQYVPDDLVDAGSTVGSVDDFDAAIETLRSNPTSDRFVHWTDIQHNFDTLTYQGTNSYRLTYMLDQLVAVGIDPIAEIYELKWGGDWASLWRQWQKHYAMTFLMARHHGVVNYQFINEPDHPAVLPNIASQDIYVQGLQIASNAIRAAVHDVNELDGGNLDATIMAPIITHSASSVGNYNMEASPGGDSRDDQHGWGEIALRNLRTDYHGKQVEVNLFDVYDTHMYGKAASFFAGEIEMIRDKMHDYNPTGAELPIIYTEFNRQNTSAFAARPDDLNTPDVFCDLAEIWGTTLGAGVQGMIAFKLENTVGADGKPYKTGFYYADPTGAHDVWGTTKSAEVNRMFARGFTGTKIKLLSTDVDEGNTAFTGWTSHDTSRHSYRIWAPHPSGEDSYPVNLDLGHLSLRASGAPAITVEEVSTDHGGDIVSLVNLPASRSVRLTQPAGSVWLITVPDQRITGQTRVVADADATVVGGTHYNENHGSDEVLTVAADASSGGDAEVAYLRFDHPRNALRKAPRVILQLHGEGTSDAQPLIMSVFAMTDASWTSAGLTWLGAPHLDRQHLRPLGVGDAVWPAGKITAPGRPGWARLDVTDAVRHATGDHVDFMVIRTRTGEDDRADDGRAAHFTSRESSRAGDRPALLLWTTT